MLAVVDELGLEASSEGRVSTLAIKHLEGEWYDIQEYDGSEEVRDRIWQQVHRTSDTSNTCYILNVGFQELYDAGFITEEVVRNPPKNAGDVP